MRARILVVEDSADSRELLVALLEDEGYEIQSCENVAAARSALAKDGRFDILITDYWLPDGLGTDVVRQAREAGLLEGTAIILFTAHPTVTLEGAKVVRKPADFDMLLSSVASFASPATFVNGRGAIVTDRIGC